MPHPTLPDEGAAATLARYVPRLASQWPATAPRFRTVAGTLCFVDISGFTALSEKLARRGRVGAEELTEVLDSVFGRMLHLAYDRGGSLLQFGGDALLLLFTGDDHARQAASATIEMRAALRDASTIPTSVGRIRLRMSVGLEAGELDLFLVGGSHRALIVTGPLATATTELEKTAEAGQILVGPAVRAALPARAVGDPRGPGRLLRSTKPFTPSPGPAARDDVGVATISSFVPTALRELLAAFGRTEPEHRVASVAFVQFKGVDRLLADEGHEAVADALDAVVRAAQDAADDEAITFLATDIDQNGGKIILVSGVPATQEDDEGRVLRAARHIVEAGTSLSVRIGVNRGHVFAGEIGTDFRATFTIMGDTVNLAARLMAHAAPGSVLATAAVLDRSRTLFETEAVEPFLVKGKRDPVHAFVVGNEVGTRVAHLHGELAFVGRDEELRAIEEATRSLAAGTGAALAIVGDAGVGKSRLVSEAFERTPPPGRLVVTGEPNGVDNPYWAFRDPMRRLLGIERRSQDLMVSDLSRALHRIDPALVRLAPLIGDAAHIHAPENDETAAIEPRFRPGRVAQALIELLEHRFPSGVAVVGEDAHWLDDASIDLLDAMRDETARRPWLVVTTSRERIAASEVPLIRLGGLAAHDVERLIVDATQGAPLRPDEIGEIVRRAGGNPLFLGEILKVVRETGRVSDLPDSLDAVVGAQIDALPELPRRLLRCASVLGRSYRRVLLDRFLEPEQVEMDGATRRTIARFVTEDGPDRWRFRHAVIRDVAYQGLSFRRRRELHSRAAAVIEELADGDLEAVAEFLALHNAAAGNHREAWRHSIVAGERAAAAYVNIEAAGHFERAIEAARRIPDLPRTDLARAWIMLGDVREAAGLYEAALSAFGAAARLTDDTIERADLHLKRARVRARVGSYRPAFRDITLGERLVDDGVAGSLAMRARLRSLRAQLRQLQERPHAAIALARRAIDDARAAEEWDALAHTYQVLDASYNMIGQPSLAVHGDEALEIFQRLGDLTGVADVTNNLGGQAYFEGDWARAVELYEQAEDAYRRAGNEAEAAMARANIAEVLISQRRYDEAEPLLAGAVRVLRAHHLVDAALFAEIQQGRLLIGQGRFDEAFEHLTEIRAEATQVGQLHSTLEAAIHLAEEHVRRLEPIKALRLLDEAERDAGPDAALFATAIARVRTKALLSRGAVDDAAEVVHPGLRTARAERLRYDEARLLEILADIVRATGDTERANELSEEAQRLLRSLGVT